MTHPPRPLDWREKSEAIQFWVMAKPALTRSALCVYARLAHRQNVNTGQCDPSTRGLADELGLSKKSIHNAVKELEGRSAISVERKANRRNHYVLIRPGERASIDAPSPRLDSNLDEVVKSASHGGEADFPDLGNGASPEKKKKKKKKNRKKGEWKNDVAEPFAGSQQRYGLFKSGSVNEISLGDFENRVRKCFEKEGLMYEDLVYLPDGLFQETYEEFSAGSLVFWDAVQKLIDAVDPSSGQGAN